MGFLIDEEEFEVAPAISRALTMFEVGTRTKARKAEMWPPSNQFELNIQFLNSVTSISELFNYTAEINVGDSENVDSYSVYINDNYIGDNVGLIQISTNDRLKIDLVKTDNTKDAVIFTTATLI